MNFGARSGRKYFGKSVNRGDIFYRKGALITWREVHNFI